MVELRNSGFIQVSLAKQQSFQHCKFGMLQILEKAMRVLGKLDEFCFDLGVLFCSIRHSF